MSGVDWRNTVVALDGTHHLIDGVALYATRFLEVLKFHAPGLAPVQDASGAFHVTVDGRAAYKRRYRRAFGFYDGLAAVDAGTASWHHIGPDGEPAYATRWAWCGNFQEGRCAVRDDAGRYLHVDMYGKPVSAARWRYAGDYRDGVAVVQRDDGTSSHVDAAGAIIHGRWFLDLDVFHKSFARARDALGWTHINASAEALYDRRFAAVEPFYNGQARVERFDGGLEVIDERGARVVELRPCPGCDGARRFVALYGPPGSGKSTVVELAHRRGVTAYDAEAFGPNHAERVAGFQRVLLRSTEGLILIGAADLTPEDFPAGTKFVLLLPPAEEHRRRVLDRRDERPHKSLQHAQQVHGEHWAMRESFDVVVDFDCSPEAVLSIILSASSHD